MERAGGPRWGNPIADAVTEPLWAWVRAFSRKADGVLVASSTQAEKLVAHGVEKVHTVRFGVDRTTFTPESGDPENRSRTATKRDGENGPSIVAVGRFASEKEWDVLIDAFLRFREKHGGHLRCFGDGPERARIEERVRGTNAITFMGFVTDRKLLADALRGADLFLHACRYETFGLSVAEAQASGLPVVVPDQGGAFEQLDTRSGASFRAGDATDAALRMEEVLGRASVPARAREVAAGIRGVEDHFRELVGLYEELIARRRQPL